MRSRVDVPRKSDVKKASDPYWFHPTGWRFRSKSEVARWREAGWDVSALQNTAFCNSEQHDGLGMSRQEAIEKKLIPGAGGATGARPTGAGSASGSAGGGKKKGGSASASASTPPEPAAGSKRARTDAAPAASAKSSSRKAAAAAAAAAEDEDDDELNGDEDGDVEGEGEGEGEGGDGDGDGDDVPFDASSSDPAAPGGGSAANTAATSAKVTALKTVVVYEAESEQPVLDIYQKDHILASARITHSFGAPIAALKLPSSIYFCQRTAVEVVSTSIRIPYFVVSVLCHGGSDLSHISRPGRRTKLNIHASRSHPSSSCLPPSLRPPSLPPFLPRSPSARSRRRRPRTTRSFLCSVPR
jgi:hypothetical protein